MSDAPSFSEPVVFQQASAKKPKLRYFLFALVSALLIFSLGSGYLFWLVPQAQAKEFIEKTSSSFDEINQKVGSIYQDFTKIKSQLPAAKSSFEEVTKTTSDYDYIKKDTEEDIKDIESVLTIVKEAEEELEKLKKPEEVQDLAEKLTTYYSTLETTLNDLLEHQQLNRALITAHGQELYDALIGFQKLYKSGGAQTDFIKACQEISNLSSEAKVRIKAITKVNPDEQDYYNAQEEFLVDVEKTFEQAAILYKSFRYNEADNLFQAFSNRNNARNKRVQENADKYVANSIAARGFQKLPTLEAEVLAEIARLIENYSLDIPGFEKEATSSATPNTVSSTSSSKSK